VVLAALLERTLMPEAPACDRISPDRLEPALADSAHVAAVLAEIEGASMGRIALIVSELAAREAIAALVERGGRQRRAGPQRDLLAASALLELGNIAFSAAANALADSNGGRVFPSVPRFSAQPARELAEGWPPGADVFVSRFELVGREGTLRVRLVWMPDPAAFE
jgi:chemotaxis protein CheY-P-specific phosphatase CheC